jgi:Tfp pilus assembly protein PilZ
LREIDCPAGCVHLGGLTLTREAAPPIFTKKDLSAMWEQLYAYADRAAAFRNEALPRVLDSLDPTPWEFDLAIGYVFYGHRDAGGHRLVDHFIAARGRDLSRGEMAAAVALRDAWASLFEVESVHAGIGLELRDLRSGEHHRVREILGSSEVAPGDVMFAWLMAVGDHVELSGVACMISRQDREAVRAAIETELAVARTRWPMIPERELVGSIAWSVAKALRTAAYEASARAIREDLLRLATSM